MQEVVKEIVNEILTSALSSFKDTDNKNKEIIQQTVNPASVQVSCKATTISFLKVDQERNLQDTNQKLNSEKFETNKSNKSIKNHSPSEHNFSKAI